MAYSQLKTSTEPFSILINLHDNRYRCLDLTDPRTTTAARTTSTSVPALSSHQVTAVTNKVNRLLTLSRVCSLGELYFRGLVTLAANDQGQAHRYTGRTLPVVPSQYLSRAPLGRPTLTFKDNRCSGPYGGKTKSASSGVQGLLLDSSHLR